MPTVVVPFRGAEGKSRLDDAPAGARSAIALAMLADVVDAARQFGAVYVVTPDELDVTATVITDEGGGQGAAVQAGLHAAARDGAEAPFLVVNADVPCVTPRDLEELAASVPPAGLALVAAADGTTNAIALSSPALFVPAYGPGSSERFAASAPSRVLGLPNLIDDVDTVADLERLRDRVGAHTTRALATLLTGAAA